MTPALPFWPITAQEKPDLGSFSSCLGDNSTTIQDQLIIPNSAGTASSPFMPEIETLTVVKTHLRRKAISPPLDRVALRSRPTDRSKDFHANQARQNEHLGNLMHVTKALETKRYNISEAAHLVSSPEWTQRAIGDSHIVEASAKAPP